jgi:hypothetical protein
LKRRQAYRPSSRVVNPLARRSAFDFVRDGSDLETKLCFLLQNYLARRIVGRFYTSGGIAGAQGHNRLNRKVCVVALASMSMLVLE